MTKSGILVRDEVLIDLQSPMGRGPALQQDAHLQATRPSTAHLLEAQRQERLPHQ
jgi:hypothetical protein